MGISNRDKPSTIDDFCFQGAFQVALLNRAQGGIHDQQFNLKRGTQAMQTLNQTTAQQCGRNRLVQAHMFRMNNVQFNRPGKADRFFQTCIRVPAFQCHARYFGIQHSGAAGAGLGPAPLTRVLKLFSQIRLAFLDTIRFGWLE